MEDFRSRLHEENSELKAKIEKLKTFLGTEKFRGLSNVQRRLLRIQLYAMETYRQCLDERIDDL